MKNSIQDDYSAAINKARLMLLIACFGVSSAAALLGVWFMFDLVREIQGNIADYVKVIGVVLSFTAAGQLIYNERLLGPIQAFLINNRGEDENKTLNPGKFAALTFGVWVAIWGVLYAGLSLTPGAAMSLGSFLLIMLGTGLLLGLLSYFMARTKNRGASLSIAETAEAVARLPFKSALFSLLMWVFAGVSIGLSFRYIVALSVQRSVDIFSFAASAGFLAFPMQYFLFKKVIEPLRKVLMDGGAFVNDLSYRFPIKYKLVIAMAALVIFGVGFFGILNLSKSIHMLKAQTETFLTKTLDETLPANEEHSLETVKAKILRIAELHDAVPFWTDENGEPETASLDPRYSEIVRALFDEDDRKFSFTMGEDLVLVREALGMGRYGIIFPYRNFDPVLGEIRSKTLFFVIVTILFATVMAFMMSRDISVPIITMKEEAGEFGKDASHKWSADFYSDDEAADLGLAFNAMSEEILQQMKKVGTLLESIGYTVHHLGTSSTELEAIAKNQAAGSSEQAAAIQQALTTAGEIAATARQIAENSLTVNNVASETSAACELSNKIVSETIGGVQEVREHVNAVAHGTIDLARLSQRIGGIVDIIEEINEQTNLISVNASIEASGAGEEGKRFIVLAREMRRLAESTIQATEEIREQVELVRKQTTSTVMMAEESTKVVDSWAAKVERLGESFSNIAMLVELASRATGEISMSTKQQTTACEQMAQVIAEVKEVADQVVLSARETEHSMTDLTELTTNLKELVGGDFAQGAAADAET